MSLDLNSLTAQELIREALRRIFDQAAGTVNISDGLGHTLLASGNTLMGYGMSSLALGVSTAAMGNTLTAAGNVSLASILAFHSAGFGGATGAIRVASQVGNATGANSASNPVFHSLSYSFVNITGNATTVVKSSAGILAKIFFGFINANSTITIYNNTSATNPVFTTFTPASTALIGTCVVLDAEMTNGITIVTAGLLATNITVMYR